MPIGPVDGQQVPRFAGPATFARLPRLDEVSRADVAIVGLPFDAGVSYRPGARFGPAHIRASSRLLRPYHPAVGVSPFASLQVADAGDLALNPFSIDEALGAARDGITALAQDGATVVGLGGDHTLALPALRALAALHGPLAVLHFDAHLDTWDTYFGAPYTHGTPFRRASEEGLIDQERSMHVGIRGPLYSAADLDDDSRLGFAVIRADDYETDGVARAVERMRRRLAGGPVYVSVDIDVLDPSAAPGTGTPEAGGLTSRELLHSLRGLAPTGDQAGLDVVGIDVVEVAPAYDHAEITGIAAAHVVYDLLAVLAATRG
ncbi:agmatinase [Actinomycetospora sp. TBRC 11914]|uniref:agmatinase n=1 Tax=Actinomycetospora sp. TBRC 11914 TaxID=2729387 RepID=UPI00145D685D|nr:agmatinase [Actinomycetospora sp. TBRC 11914]NMO91165.1 agmatinase [Actinomycetospora sp. TBRC 11914]